MTDKTTSSAAGERLAKVIARAGLCSRREAEAWIAAGRVTINDAKAASPAVNVTPRDRIAVDGKPLPMRERTRLFLYHKPRGLVTTHADPQGRPTIFGGLPKELPRVISVGRLDLNTEGLLLLTNDGGLARVLELPATGWLRRYRVRAYGEIMQDALDRLRPGVTIDGVRYGPIEATVDRVQGSNVWLTIGIREGKNREVRNVLRHLGLAVNRLIRTSFGPFQLGDLPDGGIEEVKTRILRDQLGDKLAKAAGADFSAPLAERAPPDAAGGRSATEGRRKKVEQREEREPSPVRRRQSAGDPRQNTEKPARPRALRGKGDAQTTPRADDRDGDKRRVHSSRPTPRTSPHPKARNGQAKFAAPTKPRSERARPERPAGKARRPRPPGRKRR
jgi:23S rRNA pseudouridine2605 synthase